MISVLVLLAFIFLARVINEKANKKLTTEKKAELIDLFSKSRTWTFGLLIVIIGIYFFILKYQMLEPLTSLAIYILLLLAFILYNTRMAYRKLKSNGFPDSFIRTYLISTSIRFVGILIFFGLLIK
jgi:hypothetical protein